MDSIAVEDGGGQQEGEDGERAMTREQQHVDGARHVLAAAAVGAVGRC